jgi:hypothetical protein
VKRGCRYISRVPWPLLEGTAVSDDRDCRQRVADALAAVPHAVYTSGQMLEKHSQNCHFCHFSGASARLVGGKARSAKLCSIIRSDMIVLGQAIPEPSGYRCTETATPISAACSLSRAAHHGAWAARAGFVGPHPIPAPQVACLCIDLTVTRQSSFLNHVMTPEGTNPIRHERRLKTSVVSKLTTEAVGGVASIGDHRSASLRSHRFCRS